jgi:hypothetical protein
MPPGIDATLIARPPNWSVDVAHATSDSEHVSTAAFSLDTSGAGDAWQPVTITARLMATNPENAVLTRDRKLMFPLFASLTGLSSA